MKWPTVLATAVLVLSPGCKSAAPDVFTPEQNRGPAPARTAPAPPAAISRPPTIGPAGEPVVTPDPSLRGRISRYNEAGRFVILEFGVARLPAIGQTLFVYRNGSKVGEVKVTGPQQDDRTVADLASGDAQAGDEVRVP